MLPLFIILGGKTVDLVFSMKKIIFVAIDVRTEKMYSTYLAK